MPHNVSFYLSLFGPIRRPSNVREGLHSIPTGTTIADFLASYLHLSPDETRHLVIHVNNTPANLSHTIRDGDHLSLFLPVGGGA